MARSTFNGIPIPGIYDSRTTYASRGDFGLTAGGKERGDIVAPPRRTWTLQTRPMSHEDAERIANHLRAIGGGYGDFWLDEFGPGVTVRARIADLEVRRSYRLPNRRELTIVIVEQ